MMKVGTTMGMTSPPTTMNNPPVQTRCTYGTETSQILEPTNTVFGTAWLPTITLRKRDIGIDPTVKKIPLLMWRQVVAFLCWSQNEYGQEALIHGFYNENPPEGQPNWIMEPPLQEPNGMTVQAIKTGESAEENMRREHELNSQGYHLRFTAHHHCRAAAGQSGTDRDDEHGKPTGFHITIGNLHEAQLTFHSRLVVRMTAKFDGEVMLEPAKVVQLDPPPWYFIETPVDDMIEENRWVMGSLKLFFQQRHDGTPFPEEWKNYIDVPLRYPQGATQAESDAIAIAKLGSGTITEMFNAVLALSAAERHEGFQGGNPPTVKLPWGNTRIKKRRAIYDALYRVVNFYEEVMYPTLEKGKKVFVVDIVSAYIEHRKKHVAVIGYNSNGWNRGVYTGQTGNDMGVGGSAGANGNGMTSRSTAPHLQTPETGYKLERSHLRTGGKKKLRAPENEQEWLELFMQEQPNCNLAEFKRAWVEKWGFFDEPDQPQQEANKNETESQRLIREWHELNGDYYE